MCLGPRKSIKQINKEILKMVTYPKDDLIVKTPQEFSKIASEARARWFQEKKPKYIVSPA